MTWDGIPENWGKGCYRDIPWSKYVLMVRDRQRKDLRRSLDDPSFPFFFDIDAADHAVWFFSQLRHFDAPWTGDPFILTDWQEWDIIRPLFGWRRRADGFRRFRYAYIEVPRKNGKSALMSGIGGLLSIGDNEHGAQVYAAATKEAQARIVWTQAKRMIEMSPTLSKYIQGFKSSLFCSRLGSIFKPLGRDSDTEDGLSVHGGLIDEYHAHKDSGMYDVLSTGMGARPNSMLAVITTAGNSPASPCKAESDRAKRLLEGQGENDTLFCFVSTVDDPDKWEDPQEWIKANPNYGITIFPHVFEDAYRQSKTSVLKEIAFQTKQLNIWSGQSKRWIRLGEYDKSDGFFDPKKLLGKRCFAGLDLGKSRDLTALCLAFMDDRDPEDKGKIRDVYLLLKYWCPQATIMQRYEEDGVIYPQWEREGRLIAVPGETVRTDFIRAEVARLSELYDIAEIAADPWNAAELLEQFKEDGHDVIKHSQGISAMNFPCKSIEDLILNSRLKVDCDPIFRWMIGNCAVVSDGNGNIKIMKDKSGDRVDGVVAAAMAIGRLLIAPEPFKSVYRSRGIRVLG